MFYAPYRCMHFMFILYVGDTDVPKHKAFELHTTSDDPMKIQITKGMCVFGATLLCCFCIVMILVVAIVILLVVLYSIVHGYMDMQIMGNGINLQFSAMQSDCPLEMKHTHHVQDKQVINLDIINVTEDIASFRS